MFDNPPPLKIMQLDNGKKYRRAGEITDSSITWRVNFLWWIANATNTRSEYITHTVCPRRPYYLTDTAPVLLFTEKKCVYCAVRTVSLNTIQYI